MSETPSQTQPASSASSSSTSPSGQPPRPRGLFAVKEAFTSIVIAFAMAFAFRGFVLEAFVIPTGSMAPTLLGAHYRVRSPDTGAVFAADRRLTETRRGDTISDPITNADLPTAGLPRLDGDRIFVRKRTPLSPIPDRFDVVVFRSPTEPDERVI